MKGILLAGQLAASAASAPPAPEVVSAVALRGEPTAASLGQSGPINHWRFELKNFSAATPGATVVCIYPGNMGYRCAFEFEARADRAVTDVVHLRIPDLDRGKEVAVLFRTAQGQLVYPLKLINPPRLFHETEAVDLPGGGRHITDNVGNVMPNMALMTLRAVTHPAMSTSGFASPAEVCDLVRAEWVGASATDPVFTSVFGPLQGNIAPSRPPKVGDVVTPDHSPEWLISFPMSAIRMQFIAHYEVNFRVGACAHKVVNLAPPRKTP